MPSSSKKRKTTTAFDLVSSLEQEDQAAAQLRKKQSTRQVGQAKAARSQTKIYGHLMETRILLQRSLQQTTAIKDHHKEDAVEQCDTLLEQLLQARRKLMPLDDDNTNEEDEEETLQKEYEHCQDQWKTVLNKRHQDLRLHAGLAAKNQFQVLDSSFWQQVEATVTHQQMRPTTEEDEEFEDAKVYQQMLKDFLASAATTAATETTTSSYSRSHSQKKKQVDRKASKGRKIRYVEIPKLVNFTFPVSKATHSTLNEEEWFQSLFGGGHQPQEQSRNPASTTTTSTENAQVSSDDEEED